MSTPTPDISKAQSHTPHPPQDLLDNYRKFKQRVQSARRNTPKRPLSGKFQTLRKYPIPYVVKAPDFRAQRQKNKSEEPQSPKISPMQYLKQSLKSPFETRDMFKTFSYGTGHKKGLSYGNSRATPSIEPTRNEMTSFDFTPEEEDFHANFTQTLENLRPLRFELDLNHETLRTQHEWNPVKQALKTGIYSDLKVSCEKMLQDDPHSLTEEVVVKRHQLFNKAIREIILFLKATDAQEQAILLELLWKAEVYTFDAAIKAHNKNLNDLIKSKNYLIRRNKQEHQNEMMQIQERMNQIDEINAAKVKELENSIRILQKEAGDLYDSIADRDYKIADMNNISTRNANVRRMSKLFDELNHHMTVQQREKRIQMKTLEEISTVMEMTQSLNKIPSMCDSEVQTEWQIIEPLPTGASLGTLAVVSTSSIQNLMQTQHSRSPLCAKKEISDVRLKKLCQWVLDEKEQDKESNTIDYLFMRVFIREYQSPEHACQKLAAAVTRLIYLRNLGNHFANYFSKFLALDQEVPLPSSAFTMAQQASSVYTKHWADPKLTNFIDFIRRVFAFQREVGERILEHWRGETEKEWEEQPREDKRDITKSTFGRWMKKQYTEIKDSRPNPGPTQINALLARLAVAIRRLKKPFENILNAADIDCIGYVKFDAFSLVIKQGCDMWISQNDLHILMEHFARGGSGKIRLNNVKDLIRLVETESDILSQKITVTKHEFVSACVKEWTAMYNLRSTKTAELHKNFDGLWEFWEIVEKLLPDASPEAILELYAKYLTTQQASEDFSTVILEKLNPILFTIQEPRTIKGKRRK